MPSMMVLAGGAFRCLGNEGGALMMGLVTFSKGPRRGSSVPPSAKCGNSERAEDQALSRHQICQHFDLGLPSLQKCEKYLCWLLSTLLMAFC